MSFPSEYLMCSLQLYFAKRKMDNSGSVISRCSDVNCCAASCDLTSFDFFLGSHAKDRIYAK